MTDKQPEALLYADKLEKVFGLSEYAAELRRLHQSEREGWRYADELEQERKRLHEVNAELVEALKEAAFHLKNECDVGVDEWMAVQVRAEAALTKAEGK